MAGVNMWIVAATVLMLSIIPCGIVCVSGRTVERLIGMELASTATIMALMVLAMGFKRPSFSDMAITLAFLSPAGTLLFVHYLERWK